MQTVTDTLPPEIMAGVLTGTVRSALPDRVREHTAELVFPAFHYSLSAPVVEMFMVADSSQTTVKIAVDEAVTMICELKGKRLNGKEEMEVGVYFENPADRARASFVAATLQCLLWLAGPVSLRIPTLGLDVEVGFTAPLEEVNQTMHIRHVAYQLMVIERAFDRKLARSLLFFDADGDRISFVYHAIVDRSFVWPFFQAQFPFPASEQSLDILKDADRPSLRRLNVAHYEADVLGKSLPLGRAIVTIENGVIVNIEEIGRELGTLDGHEFPALIKSLAGVATYEFPDAPRLSETKWDKRIEEILALDRQLDEAIFQAVNQLAALSLADLSDEEKAEVTARPQFD
ncbi:MAG: hypothetical protein ACREBD_18000 [Blastocatellia bacterium]